jgi:PilZ domain-containing protein
MRRLLDRFAPDRRSALRHSLRTPLRVRVWKSTIPEHAGESQNVSHQGMFFATDLSLRAGTVVEVLFKMPEEITGEPGTHLRCTGHVVHVEPVDSSSCRSGVGVKFHCYEIADLEGPQST